MSGHVPHLVFWRARDGWRWFFQARNARTVAESAEAYKGRRNCIAGFLVFAATVSDSVKGLDRDGLPVLDGVEVIVRDDEAD